jgi:hypothetical protein
MSIQTVTISSPPLVWDEINSAFTTINQNFAELNVNFSSAGFLPLNLLSVSVDISPVADNLVSLGSPVSKWKSVYVDNWGDSISGMNNGVWIGNAQIKGYGNYVDIPANSTIGGQPIIDTTRTSFKNITVAGQSAISAAFINDTLTLTSNGSLGFLTYPDTKVLEIYNNGVLTLTPGTGLSATSNTGNVTLVNTGVVTLTAGSGISVNSASGNVIVSNAGIVSVVTASGSGLSSSFNSSTGALTLTNAGIVSIVPGAGITVSTSNGVSTISSNSIATISAGSGISVSTTSGASTITNSGIISVTAGSGISVSTTSGASTITNSGIISVTAGSGISVSTTSGIATISSAAYSYNSIIVSGQTTVTTTNTNDSLTLVAGAGIAIATGTNQVTLSVTDIVKSTAINIRSTGSILNLQSASGGLTLTNNGKSWVIDDTGNLNIPNGGDIKNSATGLSIIPKGISNRANYTATTASLVNNASAVLAVSGFNTYALYSVTTSVAATVKIYNNTANATTNGATGLIYTATTTAGNLTVNILPAIIGYVDISSISSTPYIQTNVTNTSGTSTAVSVTLTVLKLEI